MPVVVEIETLWPIMCQITILYLLARGVLRLLVLGGAEGVRRCFAFFHTTITPRADSMRFNRVSAHAHLSLRFFRFFRRKLSFTFGTILRHVTSADTARMIDEAVDMRAHFLLSGVGHGG